MASARAEEVAEILWELKRADKVATYTEIAQRAGFSPGAGGRTVATCLKTVRRDWPHLQWWRAIGDDCVLEKGGEQESKLREAGYNLSPIDGKNNAVALCEVDSHLMHWNGEEQPASQA